MNSPEMNDDVVRLGHHHALDYLAMPGAITPSASAVDALAQLTGSFPEQPQEATETIDLLASIGSPATIRSNGPRYFGFVTGGAQPVAMAAAALASAWDQNGALPVMSPTASALDETAARWMIDALALPASATGVFCGGASEANLIGLIAARDAVLHSVGWDVPGQGLAGAPPITVVTGAEVHVSATKAVALAGLGRDRLALVPTDRQGRLDPSGLATALNGVEGPKVLILQAGNVNTGHSDPFADVIPIANEAGAWVHVDGAFGLWAASSPTRRELVAGVEGADSWAVDAHKWLNVNYDAALAVVSDSSALARSMRADAAYLPDTGGRAPMHLGLQMSQRARGIETWAALRTLGRSGVADLIDRCCELASHFAELLVIAGAEVLHDVVLNQVLVSFGSDSMTNRVIDAVQAEGTCWAGGTTWQGRAAMRLSVSGWETTTDDIDRSAAAIVECWGQLVT